MAIELTPVPTRGLLTMAEGAWRAARIGGRVEVNRTGRGAVHSVFPRAVNCVVEDQLWTLLPTDALDAPYGVRLEGGGLIPGDLGIDPGDPVRVRGGFVAVGNAVVDCRAAGRWLPAPPALLGDGWAARFEAVGALAAPRAWPGSADLAERIVDALMEPPGSASLPRAVDRAVGRGPGLTPSGDDVLVGLLAALWFAVPSTEYRTSERMSTARSRVAAAWVRTPARTTDISRYLVDQATQGLFGAGLHGLLRALAATAPQDLLSATEVLLAMGASSGADTCVGVVATGRLLSCFSLEGTRR